jgi:hypothetical protein
MRRAFRVFALAAALGLAGVVASGCATISVSTDYDHTVDFSRYRTFSFVGGHIWINGVRDDGNTLVNDRIHRAIVDALAAKGLREVPTDPDLQVGYLAGARTRTEVEGVGPYAPGFGPYLGWDEWWGPMYTDWWTRTYEEGTLIIDLIDAHTKKLVWRAYARTEVNPPVTDEKIRKAVGKAFTHFPPPRK